MVETLLAFFSPYLQFNCIFRDSAFYVVIDFVIRVRRYPVGGVLETMVVV